MKSKFVIFVLILMLSAFMLVGCKSDQDAQPAEAGKARDIRRNTAGGFRRVLPCAGR